MAITYDDFERQARQSGLYDSFNAEDLALAKKNPQTGVLILNAKRDYMNAPAGAAGDNIRALAHESIQNVRRKLGNYETSADGMTVTYLPSQSQGNGSLSPASASGNASGNDHYKALLWAEKKYGAAEPSNKGDAYAQYEKTINAQREAAQKDAIGKTAALTGGYGSSSAVQAANSVASEYARVLAEKELELSQEAYNRKLSEAQLAASLGDYTKLNALGINTAEYEDQLAKERAQNNYAALLAQAEAAAKYGDTSKLAALGIDTTKAAADTEYERKLNEAKLAAQYGDFSKLQALGIDTSAVQAAMQNQAQVTPTGSVNTSLSGSEGALSKPVLTLDQALATDGNVVNAVDEDSHPKMPITQIGAAQNLALIRQYSEQAKSLLKASEHGNYNAFLYLGGLVSQGKLSEEDAEAIAKRLGIREEL